MRSGSKMSFTQNSTKIRDTPSLKKLVFLEFWVKPILEPFRTKNGGCARIRETGAPTVFSAEKLQNGLHPKFEKNLSKMLKKSKFLKIQIKKIIKIIITQDLRISLWTPKMLNPNSWKSKNPNQENNQNNYYPGFAHISLNTEMR